MITKDDLKDWLNENARNKYAEKLEKYIDSAIKSNALEGNTTFYISTGRYTTEGSKKTPFYDVWNSNELSEENRKIVHQRVINNYKEFGFDVETTTVDCGWHNKYFALKFNNINRVVED